MKRVLAALLTAAISPSWAGYCYEVFSPRNELVYRSTQAPVDMERPLEAGLAARGWPAHHLTYYPDSGFCVEVLRPPPGLPSTIDPAAHSAALEGLADRNRATLPEDVRPDHGYRVSRHVHTGPRGGRYVITSGGNRSYQRRRSR